MNFGSSIGIHGDGLADGSVQASFWLAAGDYSLVIGGADISSVDTASYGLNTSLTVIPEFATSWLIGLSGFSLMLYRRRPSVSLESSMVINPRKQFPPSQELSPCFTSADGISRKSSMRLETNSAKPNFGRSPRTQKPARSGCYA